MSGSLRNNAIKGTIWAFVERFSVQLVQFVITLIMARILTPADYGLIGMLAIFISLSQVFIDGGFSSALIQKKDVSPTDYSTVFYINFVLSLIIYSLLFLCAPHISNYYQQPVLTPVLRIYSLNLIINSLGAVQKTILTIKVDFKTQSKISFISAILSGIIGIVFAFYGFGVWSLVSQSIAMAICSVILTFIYVTWRPMFVFSLVSFKRLFSFGSKLLIAQIISSVYDNLYNIVIGKKFSATDLGYYTRARQFPELVSVNISGILSRVSYPILSKVQDEDERLKGIYKRYIEVSSFIIFPLLMVLVGLAKPIITLLLTEKWIEAASLLQILCFGLLWSGITTINLSLLKVKGRSDLVLKLEILKKLIAVSILFLSLIFNSLSAICLGIVAYSLIAVILNTYYTEKLLHYGFISQIKDFGIYLVLSLFIMFVGLFFTYFIQDSFICTSTGIFTCIFIYIALCKLFKCNAISECTIIFNSIIQRR